MAWVNVPMASATNPSPAKQRDRSLFVARTRPPSPSAATITPSTIEPESNRSAQLVIGSELQGEWRLVEIAPGDSVNPLRRALANAQSDKLSVRITGRKAELRGPGLHKDVTAWVHATSAESFSVLLDLEGESVRFRARQDGNSLWLESSSGAWAGRARLERVTR